MKITTINEACVRVVQYSAFAVIAHAALTNIASAQSQSAVVPDGEWKGTRACGPGLTENSKAPNPFSQQITMTSKAGMLRIEVMNKTTRDTMTATVTDPKTVAIVGDGNWIETPSNRWAHRFNGWFTGAQFSANGAIESVDGKTKFRDCTLNLTLVTPGQAAPVATTPPAASLEKQAQTAQAASQPQAQKPASAAATAPAPQPQQQPSNAPVVAEAAGRAIGGFVGGVLGIPQRQTSTAQTPTNIALPKVATGTAPLRNVTWPSRQALFQSVQNGEFKTIYGPNYGSDNQFNDKVADSVLNILYLEYNAPQIHSDRACHIAISGLIASAIQNVNLRAESQLSNEPPNFIRMRNAQQVEESDRRLTETLNAIDATSSYGTHCSPRPYSNAQMRQVKQALAQLAQEFAKVAQARVDNERQQRATAYQQQQARMAAAKRADEEEQARRDAAQQAAYRAEAAERAKQEAQLKAAEQRRIDAEAARIRQEQERRQQIEKNRVGG